MSEPVLSVSNLGKAFRAYRSEWQRLISWFYPDVTPAGEHWVMRRVSFAVAPGEAIGIVGQNGAGKSTLLKLIAGTLRPTEGEVISKGRIAALLELGTGFNAEFTGRQNAFHGAGLMGFGRPAIRSVMPQIETFADIGEYFDEPVRMYSSGMQLRVAFAVATAFRPDILLVDEALAVGDAAFQRKCFQRIEDFRAAGTTLLFVSHDTETIKTICSRALFINNGHLALLGSAKAVCDEYERHLFTRENHNAQSGLDLHPSRFDPALTAPSCEVVYGSGKAEITACWLENPAGQRINVADTGQPIVWRYSVRFNESVGSPIFGMMLKTVEGVAIYGIDSQLLGAEHRTYSSGEVIDVRFELSNNLAPGIYYLNCGVRLDLNSGTEFLTRRVDTALIRIVQGAGSTAALGLLDMQARLMVTSRDEIFT